MNSRGLIDLGVLVPGDDTRYQRGIQDAARLQESVQQERDKKTLQGVTDEATKLVREREEQRWNDLRKASAAALVG